MAGLVGGLGKAGAAMVADPPRRNVGSHAQEAQGMERASAKAKARERMKKYWAARKAKGGARAKATKAAPAEAPKA